MELFFKKEIHEARFLDPNDEFQEKLVRFEVRTDSFTGSKARVLAHRWRLPKGSLDSFSISKSKEKCPFCPERVNLSTPKFSPSITPSGRIRYGQATVLPNAFPYSRYSGVVVFSDDHHIPLNLFTPEILFNALIASTIYIKRVQEVDGSVAYTSINWNYMPPAGGGIIHPHLQIVVDKKPTNLHGKLIKASLDYEKSRGSNYWSDLIRFEQQRAERYLFDCGKAVFLTSFCPRGMLGEVLSIFDETTSVQDVTQDRWMCFAKGLSQILFCFHHLHVDSFNMTLFASLEKDEGFWVQARIIPRVSLPPLGTSDVNYFEKGHDEVITIISPEDLAGEINAFAEQKHNKSTKDGR